MATTIKNKKSKTTLQRRDFLRKNQSCLSLIDAVVVDNEIKNESAGKFGQRPTDHESTLRRGESNE